MRPALESRRPRLGLLAAGALLVGAALVAPSLADASDPTSSTLTVPTTAGQTVSASWTGTIPVGANPSSTCAVPATDDQHTVTLSVPAGAYDSIDATVTFRITWTDPAGVNDEILTVLKPDGSELDSSDGGNPVETVTADNLPGGAYTAVACPFAAVTPQAYSGTVTVTTRAKPVAASLPLVERGLDFAASIPTDLQRSEGEPAITVDPSGRLYTCGPNGFSNIADYAQVSTDGGDSWHLLGQAPRGQISGGEGGGDCALASAPVKNASGDYQLAYAGLGPLTNFSTFTSPDGGRTITPSPVSESVPGVDRQWIVFTDATTAFLNYNSLAQGGQTVQKSTDGGLTYGVGKVVATDGDRIGQLRQIPAGTIPGQTKPIVLFPYSAPNAVKLALSQDGGETWSQCLVAKTAADPNAGFVSADVDKAGNVYAAWAEKGGGRDTYLTALSASKVLSCKGTSSDSAQNNVDPGWTKPTRVNRGGVETTVMPWVAAGGATGRAAVAFYGTQTVGDPDSGDFKASWFVYVNQTLDAFAADPAWEQQQASTHPFHYDSICLGGLGCDTSVPAGDRSLVDYFTMEYDKVSGRLVLVYANSGKKPDEAEGHISNPVVLTQRAGPSNGGGTLTARRAVVQTGLSDVSGDALSNYSSLVGAGAATPSAGQPALDLTGVKVDAQRDPLTGKPVADGGFAVRMSVKDLSAAALRSAVSSTNSGSLVYLFRFVDGWQPAAVGAYYSPVTGWSFGYSGYQTTTANPGGTLEIYPGTTKLDGVVDAAAGTITIQVPRSLLTALSGSAGPGQRPAEVKATAGSRIYDALASALANPSPDPHTQSFLYQVDNTGSFDFLVPGTKPAPVKKR